MARLQAEQARLKLILAYAPTDAPDLDVKDNFYDQLQLTVDVIHRYDIVLIIGEFNAKVAPVKKCRR